jgi:hypothetical protein
MKSANYEVHHHIILNRISRILPMMYDTQIYWRFGLCPSSLIKKLEYDVSETGSVSVLR